jgi:hypothetical protein
MNDALKLFQEAKKDPSWTDLALESVIEIYLNPQNNIVGGEAIDGELKDARATLYAASLFIKVHHLRVAEYRICPTMKNRAYWTQGYGLAAAIKLH